jgi:hypothetical protein
MISTDKLDKMITTELGNIELLRADVQAVLGVCAVMVHPRWLQAMTDRLNERAADFAPSVREQGPYRTAAAARAVIAAEAKYVTAALDDRLLM